MSRYEKDLIKMNPTSGAKPVLGSLRAAARRGSGAAHLAVHVLSDPRQPPLNTLWEKAHPSGAGWVGGGGIPVSSVTGFTLVRSSSCCGGTSPPRRSCRSSLRDSPPRAAEPEPWPLTWEGKTGPEALGLRPAGSSVRVRAYTRDRKPASGITVWLFKLYLHH